MFHGLLYKCLTHSGAQAEETALVADTPFSSLSFHYHKYFYTLQL
jgi:hypothetical protein